MTENADYKKSLPLKEAKVSFDLFDFTNVHEIENFKLGIDAMATRFNNQSFSLTAVKMYTVKQIILFL